jgi:hypothetical protein
MRIAAREGTSVGLRSYRTKGLRSVFDLVKKKLAPGRRDLAKISGSDGK